MYNGSDEKAGPEKPAGPMEISVLESEDKRRLDLLTNEERRVFFQVMQENDLDVNRTKWESWEEMLERELVFSADKGPAGMPELVLHKLVNLSIFEGQNYLVPIVGPVDPVRKQPAGLKALKFTTTAHITVETFEGKEEEEWGLAKGPGDEIVAYGFSWSPPVEPDSYDRFDRGIMGIIGLGESQEFRGPAVPARILFNPSEMAQIDTYFKKLYTYFRAFSQMEILTNLLSAAKISAVWPSLMLGAPKLGWTSARTEKYVKWMIESPDVAPYTPVLPAKDLILEKIGALFNQTFAQNPGLTTFDLYNIGQLALYHLAKEKGVDGIAGFRALEQQKIWDIILGEIRARNISNKYEEQIILGFIRKKLGATRFNEVVRALRAKPYLMGPKIIEVLKEPERKLIQLERTHYTKQIEAAVSNKCPHLPLSYRLRNSLLMADLDKIFGQVSGFMSPENYKKLRAYIDSIGALTEEDRAAGRKKGGPGGVAAPDQEIPCTNCNFDLICPHLAISIMMRRAPFGLQRAALGPYIDEPVGDNYYCNICGELISTTEIYGQIVTDQSAETLSNIDEPSYELISSEIVPIVRLIQATELLPFNKLMKHVIATIYPYIFEIEKQLGKIQTDKDEHDNRYKLFIAIYALAAIIHIIISSNGSAGSRSSPIYLSMKGISGPDALVTRPGATKNSEDTVALLKFGLARLMDLKNVIINKLHNVTPEFVKNKLIEAYKTISAAGSASVVESPKENEMFNMVITDPVFHYLFSYYGAKLSGKHRPNMIELLPALLGQHIEDIAKRVKARTSEFKKKAAGGKKLIVHAVGMKPADTAGEDVYEKVRVPKMTEEARKFIDIEPFSAKKSEFGASYIGPGRNDRVWRQIFVGYRDACAHAFFGWVVARKWDAYMDKIDFGPELPKILAAESKLDVYWKMSVMKNVYAQRPKSTFNYVAKNIKLGRIYEESGNKHQWTIYVMKGADGKTVELTRADIIKIVEVDKKQHNLKIIDKKCSGCGVLLSASEGLDEKKIRAALSHEINLNNLVLFFENLCPVDENMHTMNKGTCTKCGFRRDMDGAARESYYAKYAAKYTEIRSQNNAAKNVPEPEDKPKTLKIGQEAQKYAKDWTGNSAPVISLCQDLGLNLNAFNGLGATERRPYAEIISGKEIEPEKEILSTRATVVDNYLTSIIIDYNRIKNVDNYLPGKEPQYILDLMNETRAGRKQLKDLAGPDPGAFAEYQERLVAMRHARKPRDVVTFIIEHIAIFSAQIIKKGGELGKKFITQILSGIMARDELRSKPGSFNWNVFKAEDEALQAEEYDPNFDNDAGIETKEALQEESLGTTDKPLQSNFDLDLEPDQEEEEFLEDNQLGLEDPS